MIYLASDHAGFDLKEKIKAHLKEKNIEFKDMGPNKYDRQDDYPDFIIPAAKKVAEDPDKNRGIIFGASGQGEAIAANKVKGIRTVLFYGGPEDIITLSRAHNNANILSIGARFVDAELAKKVIKLWLETPFPKEERHLRRIKKVSDFENKGD